VSEAEITRSDAGGPDASEPGQGRTRRSMVLRFVAANQWVLLLALTLVLGLITGLVNERFFNPRNLFNILEQTSVLGLVAAGATILIISGNFDISVGAIVGFCAVVMSMIVLAGYPEELAMLAAIIVAVLCSMFNAVIARAFQAPTFIVSLATLGIFTGIGLWMTAGVIQMVPNNFTFLTSTRIGGQLPLIWLISLAGYVAVGLLLKYTRIGRRTYAIGDNPRAAFLAGIDVSRTTVLLFAINGVLVGLAAIVLISRIGSALPDTGAGLELRAIGAVVIGGVPITGGRGGVVGTFFGVLLLGVISNMLNLMRVDPFLQDIAFGALIVLAIGVSWLRTRVGTEG
jgi:ribose transport system permease protein